MDEYIERKAVINDIGELFTLCNETLPNAEGHHFIVESELQTHLDHVKSLPAADVVEVVRCRDCVWWSDITAVSYPDAHECRRTALYKLPDFYCAHGKRRDGGQDE